MDKNEIDNIVNTVVKNNRVIRGLTSVGVSKRKIRALVEKLISKGIEVKTVSAPYSEQIVEDPLPRCVTCDIVTYIVGPQYPLKIDGDADVVFLYQWYKHRIMTRHSMLRLKYVRGGSGLN